jgi:hypothetical protein
MYKLKIKCTRFESNYSNNTCQSNENVAAVAYKGLGKRKYRGQNYFLHQN